MSQNATTLASALTAEDRTVRLTSGTGVQFGSIIEVDSEKMVVNDVSQTPIFGVERGRYGTAAVAHASSSAVAVYTTPRDRTMIPAPRTYTYTASGALTVAPGRHLLSGPAGSVTMTLRRPTLAEEGIEMEIQATTAEAYTVTQTTPGFNSGSTASDVATYNAIGDMLRIKAVGGAWLVIGNEGVVLA